MECTIVDDSLVVASENHLASQLDDEVVLLNMDNGIYYGLNAIGALIWESIQEPQTVRRLRDVVLREYDVAEERAERDVINLLQRLEAEGLIHVS